MIRRPPISTRTDTLFPDTTLFRSQLAEETVHFRSGIEAAGDDLVMPAALVVAKACVVPEEVVVGEVEARVDRDRRHESARRDLVTIGVPHFVEEGSIAIAVPRIGA